MASAVSLSNSPSGPVEDGPAEELRLFRQARTGDFLAFEGLVWRLQNRVHALALRILGPSRTHDAEDVVQQTFLGMIEHLEDFREESTVAA